MKKKIIRRRFLGELSIVYLKDGKTKDRIRNNFNKKHLKAYLRGDDLFSFGRDEYNKPIMFEVLKEYY